MNLPGVSVRNPVAVNLLMWMLIGVGAWYGLNLTREFFPAVDPEQISVSIPYPGAVPEEIERTVIQRLEREVQDLDGIEKVESRVFEGLGVTILTLEQGANREIVLGDVRGAVDLARPEFPDGSEEPEIALVRPFFPVITVVASGDVSEERLHDVSTQVRDDLLDLPGISRLAVSGRREKEIWVEVRPTTLEEQRLSLEEVGRSVARSNVELAGGQIEAALGNVGVRTLGETSRALELEDTVIVAQPGGGALRLRDLGKIHETFEDTVRSARFKGERAVSLIVFKSPEDDAIELADAVRDYVDENEDWLGGTVRLSTSTDLSRFIRDRIDLMLRNGLWGLVFVALTLILFLHVRVAFWVVAGLAISFLGTFILMDLVGATINMISLFGLIVVLGLVVDDAIVVGENVHTKIREGLAPRAAAEKGAMQVALPVTCAVLTTIVAFAPMAYIDGIIGTFMRQLPLVVMAALLVSLLEALVILPCHLAHPGLSLAWIPRSVTAFFGRLGELRSRFFEQTLPDQYEKVLRVCLRWRYASLAAAICIAMWTGGMVAGGLVPFVLFPESDAESVVLDLEMAAGTSEQRTMEVASELEALVLGQPETLRATTVFGSSFSERGREVAADPATVAQINIELRPAEQRQAEGLRASTAYVNALREEVGEIPGARRLKISAQTGGPGGRDIELQIRGEDPVALSGATAWLRETLEDYDAVSELEDNLVIGKVETRLRLRDDAAALGLRTADLGSQLRNALFGFEAQRLQVGDEEVKVRVLFPEDARSDLGVLGRMRIVTPTGARVPLEEVAEISTGRGYAAINRVDGQRAITMTAEVDATRGNTAEITTDLGRRLEDIGERFPGVSVVFEGQRKQTTESLGSLKFGFPLALAMIYVIIAVLFRSYLQPLLVMLPIPFAFVGATLGHLVAGSPFTFLSLIGGVALTGIVVNDSLILVDFINHHRKGLSVTEAVVAGGRARLRAILLTTITTIAGLAPLMTETSFQAQFLIPMAISIVYGLAFATVLILILLPVFYHLLEDARRGARGLMSWLAAR